jgi:hypothetical protein
MNSSKPVRVILAVLWGLFLALYVACKIHFFTRYDPLGLTRYLEKHSTYWVALGTVALLIWLIEKWFSQKPR